VEAELVPVRHLGDPASERAARGTRRL
jgi:hypothetical protein